MPNCVKFLSSWLTSARVSPAVAAPSDHLNQNNMPPPKKDDEKGAMAIFHVGHQLGSVGHAFMDAAIDQAPGFIDVNTGKEMEGELDKAELKRQALKGEIKPCGMEHIYYMFPRDKKK